MMVPCRTFSKSESLFADPSTVLVSNSSYTAPIFKFFGVLESPRAVDVENDQKQGERTSFDGSKANVIFFDYFSRLCVGVKKLIIIWGGEIDNTESEFLGLRESSRSRQLGHVNWVNR